MLLTHENRKDEFISGFPQDLSFRGISVAKYNFIKAAEYQRPSQNILNYADSLFT